MTLTRLLLASSSPERMASLESRLRNLGGSDLFLSKGDPAAHIGALEARKPRAVILAPESPSETFQYLLLKRSITGRVSQTPTLVVASTDGSDAYRNLVSVGDFELVSPSLPDDAFLEVIDRTLKLFESHLELTKTKESLRESELELKGLINTLTDGVIVTDTGGVIQRTNPAMCSLLGLQQSDLIEEPFETLIGEHEVIRLTGLPALFEESHSITGMTVTFRRRDGSFLPLSLSGKPLPSPHGEAKGYVLVARDVRDTLFLMQNESRDAARVREEHQKLQQTTDEKLAKVHSILSHSERLSQIGQLVAGIGHEINSPLHLIQLSLQEVESYSHQLYQHLRALFEPAPEMTPDEVIELNQVTGEFETLFGSLKSSVEMAAAGAERLMSVSSALRVQARREDTYQEELSVNDLVEQALTLLRYRLTSVEVATDYNDLPFISGFSTHLVQVFTNILVNACDALEECRTNKATNFTPRLSVITRLAAGHIQVIFSDNGPGVPEELRQEVFDDFFTTKDAGKGTGIGLALSRKFIDDHGGTISVGASEILGGAEFRISLPQKSKVAKAPKSIDSSP